MCVCGRVRADTHTRTPSIVIPVPMAKIIMFDSGAKSSTITSGVASGSVTSTYGSMSSGEKVGGPCACACARASVWFHVL